MFERKYLSGWSLRGLRMLMSENLKIRADRARKFVIWSWRYWYSFVVF